MASREPTKQAKRRAPDPVKSVLTDTLRLEAPLGNGRVGSVQAFDRQTGKLAWSVIVFRNVIQKNKEEDTQWRFIKALELDDDTLRVTAEDGATYRLSLETRIVERSNHTPKRANQTPEPTPPSGASSND